MLEDLHELIHTNLMLLREMGLSIEIEKGLFRERNLPGFERVGYALLSLVDPSECKKSIPWPLLDDIFLRREFRTNFTKFIKAINAKYSWAEIPEIAPSNLQFPGGITFLRLMYKLSVFVLKLQLNRNLSHQEMREIFPKPDYTKMAKDLKAKIVIVRGARFDAENSLLQTLEYENAALPVLQDLTNQNDSLIKNIKLIGATLEEAVSCLQIDDERKKHLVDINDNRIITDWNERITEKIKELEYCSQNLKNFKDLSTQCFHLMNAVVDKNRPSLVLDGKKLGLDPAVAQFSETSMYNRFGDVILERVLSVGLEAAQKLSNKDPALVPMLDNAQHLLSEAQRQVNTATPLRDKLTKIIADANTAISVLRPVIYSEMREKNAPDFFKYLNKQEAIELIIPNSFSKGSTYSKIGRPSLSKSYTRSNVTEKRLVKVLCSLRQKRINATWTPGHRGPVRMQPSTGKRRSLTCYKTTHYKSSKLVSPTPSRFFNLPSLKPSRQVSSKAPPIVSTPLVTSRLTQLTSFIPPPVNVRTITSSTSSNCKPFTSLEIPKMFETEDSEPSQSNEPYYSSTSNVNCRKSLFGELPSGKRRNVHENFSETTCKSTSLEGLSQDSGTEDYTNVIPEEPEKNGSHHKRQKRDSLQGLINRYLELRKKI